MAAMKHQYKASIWFSYGYSKQHTGSVKLHSVALAFFSSFVLLFWQSIPPYGLLHVCIKTGQNDHDAMPALFWGDFASFTLPIIKITFQTFAPNIHKIITIVTTHSPAPQKGKTAKIANTTSCPHEAIFV